MSASALFARAYTCPWCVMGQRTGDEPFKHEKREARLYSYDCGTKLIIWYDKGYKHEWKQSCRKPR